jgi:hypothetical protein
MEMRLRLVFYVLVLSTDGMGCCIFNKLGRREKKFRDILAGANAIHD